MADKLSRLIDILNYSSELLNDSGIKDSRLNAELLMADVLKCTRLKLYLDFDKPLLKSESEIFKKYLRRRLNHEPIQYILGYTEFYGYRIKVCKGVFIPRQDTEVLVEKLLENIYMSMKNEIRIFEIGCGSGCIAVSIISELSKNKIKCRYDACDISNKSVDLTKENLSLNNIAGEANIFIGDFINKKNNFNNYDYIVSNPPYIPLEKLEKLDREVRDFEPLNSLTDSNDGLRFLNNIAKLKINNDLKSKIFIEIGEGQKDLSEKILRSYNIDNYMYHKDLSGIYRVLEIH